MVTLLEILAARSPRLALIIVLAAPFFTSQVIPTINTVVDVLEDRLFVTIERQVLYCNIPHWFLLLKQLKPLDDFLFIWSKLICYLFIGWERVFMMMVVFSATGRASSVQLIKDHTHPWISRCLLTWPLWPRFDSLGHCRLTDIKGDGPTPS